MNKEFFDKHSEELECACCEFLKECVEIYDRPLCQCGYTKYLEDKLALTEKALELACEDKPRPIKYYGNYMGSVNDYIEFYKTKAKEMMSDNGTKI